MFSREEALASLEVRTILLQGVEKFAKDDAGWPDINLLAIVFLHENELWRTVKPSGHMAGKLTLHYLPKLSGLVKNWRDLTSIKLSYIKTSTVLLRLESIALITQRGRCIGCFGMNFNSTIFHRRHHIYIIHVDSQIWSLIWFFLFLIGRHDCRLNTLRGGAIRILAAARWWCAKAELVVLSEKIVYYVILAGDAFELSSEAKVANPDGTVLEDEQVGGFDVTMYDTGWVDVLKTTQQVVHNGLDVALCQVKLSSVDLPKVWRGRLKHQVQRLESLWVIGLENIVKLDDVTMLGELAQDEYLTEHTFGIGYIREKLVNFFNSDAFAGDAVDGQYYVTEATRTYLLYEGVSMSNTELHLETILLGYAGHLQLWLLCLAILIINMLSGVIYYRNRIWKIVSKLDHFPCWAARFIYQITVLITIEYS